ncbi:hypothetical protein NP493_828g01014 [Ridgeia piscesae]|uniref:Uncharacterized protein n=1 Tax=Ridgeia piscesae TaxID=27915 RepID=A0AAD9KNP9_RIDPI|nr:hypothetical protein NP493_828g01014 [Ridgeia piscesae]
MEAISDKNQTICGGTQYQQLRDGSVINRNIKHAHIWQTREKGSGNNLNIIETFAFFPQDGVFSANDIWWKSPRVSYKLLEKLINYFVTKITHPEDSSATYALTVSVG